MIPEILIGSSLAIGAYQDYRTRLVSDYAFIPLALGVVVQAFSYPIILVSFGILSVLCFLLVRLKMMGEADIFAMSSLGIFPSFPAIFVGFTVLTVGSIVHVAIRFLRKEDLQTGYPFVVYSLVGFVAGALFFLRV